MFEKLAERFKEKSKEQEITFRSYDESVALAEPQKEEAPEKKQTSLTAESRGGAAQGKGYAAHQRVRADEVGRHGAGA